MTSTQKFRMALCIAAMDGQPPMTTFDVSCETALRVEVVAVILWDLVKAGEVERTEYQTKCPGCGGDVGVGFLYALRTARKEEKS